MSEELDWKNKVYFLVHHSIFIQFSVLLFLIIIFAIILNLIFKNRSDLLIDELSLKYQEKISINTSPTVDKKLIKGIK